jgi:nitroreductase
MSEYEHLLALMRSRRSIRQFSNAAVARQVIQQLLEAARWAPSNHNRQPWRFIVLEDRQEIANLAETVSRHLAAKLKELPAIAASYAEEFTHYATFFAQAPVLLVALHKQPISVTVPLLQGLRNPELVSGEPLSVGLAVQNLLLAAHALGLGTCVLTGPLLVQNALVQVLDLPAGYHLTCLVAIGYPAESPPTPRRKTVEQIAEFRNNSNPHDGTRDF